MVDGRSGGSGRIPGEYRNILFAGWVALLPAPACLFLFHPQKACPTGYHTLKAFLAPFKLRHDVQCQIHILPFQTSSFL